MNDSALLGYSMQLGAGSYQAFAAYTWVYDSQAWQFGAQVNYQTALDDNDENYRVGDKFLSHTWLAYELSTDWSVSARLSFTDQAEMDGQDDRLNPMMMPTADATMRGYSQLDGALGVNYVFNQGALKGHRLALEYSVPIDQDVDGIQMEQSHSLTLGWQYAF